MPNQQYLVLFKMFEQIEILICRMGSNRLLETYRKTTLKAHQSLISGLRS